MSEGLLLQTHVHGTRLAFMGMQLDMKKPVVVGDTRYALCQVTTRGLHLPGRVAS